MSETTSYDEIPYCSKSFPSTHPDSLAVWATLLGMTPTPPDSCRVLELGCGLGSNLIPMAVGLPGSRFLGLDLSSRQIEAGRQIVTDLGLDNIDLRAANIMEFDPGLGQFDYIVCHGVYSWVPEVVRDKILAICKQHLAPMGVAYVSYNTYPGWHIKGMIREMMAYHAQGFTDPRERVEQARALVELLAEAVGDAKSTYGQLLELEANDLRQVEDTYIFHEHLEEVNRPFYFHQFAAQASAQGLQYLAEALPLVLTRSLTPQVARKLGELSGDVIQAEQYLDFVRNQTFRRTLLCHQEVVLKRPPAAGRLAELHVTSMSRPSAPQPSDDLEAKEEFRSRTGYQISSNNPFLKTALRLLYEMSPAALPVAGLVEQVEARLAAHVQKDRLPADGPRYLADAMLQCCLSQFVKLHVRPPRLVRRPGSHPAATALARYQAQHQLPLINQLHSPVELDPLDQFVLQHLDGRDRAALLALLEKALAEGELVNQSARNSLGDGLAGTLDVVLDRLGQHAMLVA